MEQAKGELVPGGLAMVYGLGADTAHNNGLMVVTERQGITGETTPSGGEYGASGGWLCVSEHILNRAGERGYGYFLPRNLMPIKPEADPLHTERLECLTQ